MRRDILLARDMLLATAAVASTPGPAAQPAQAPHRTSRVLLEAALLALQLREYTIKALAEHLAERHPSYHLDMERLIERLVERGEVEFVGADLGLTEEGEDAAARIRERPAPRISQSPNTETERRTQALAMPLRNDPQLLTRGQRRTGASAADLASPPMRPGCMASLELPSRIGNELHYRDGRVTRMDGTELQPARRATDYRPSREGRSAVELAGACTTCPKRSGQTPELYGDLIKRDEPLYKWGKAQHGSADICTDPDCFAEKKKAHLANQRAEMEVKGAKVVGGSAAMAAIDAYGNVKGAYIALGDVRAEIKKLADDKKPEVVTIQNPRNGQTVKAVKRADLADAGAKVEKHAKVQDKWTVDQKAREQDRAKLAAEAAALTAQNMRLLAAVRAAAASLPRTALDLQLIALTTWDGTAYQAKCTLAQLYGFQKPDELATCISGMDVNALGLFCLDCALVEDVEVSIYHLDTKPEALLRAAEHYGVDLNAPAGEEPATVPEDALADDPTT